MEEWRDIEGYEGLYQVSNEGRIKSLERTVKFRGDRVLKINERIKSQFKMTDGYYGVTLCKSNKCSVKKIARLVAQTFIPNPNNLPEVNHKDEDKSNNKVDNLEWCSRSYNINYGTRNKRVGEQLEKRVCKMSLNGKIIRIYNSLTEASNESSTQMSAISNCCNKKNGFKTANGFKWKFYE